MFRYDCGEGFYGWGRFSKQLYNLAMVVLNKVV